MDIHLLVKDGHLHRGSCLIEATAGAHTVLGHHLLLGHEGFVVVVFIVGPCSQISTRQSKFPVTMSRERTCLPIARCMMLAFSGSTTAICGVFSHRSSCGQSQRSATRCSSVQQLPSSSRVKELSRKGSS